MSNGQCLLIDHRWPRIWHGSDESDPSSQGSCRARGKVLLVGLTWITDVDVGVYEARETDNAVGGDTVNVGLHGRGTESKKVKRLD